MHSRYLLGRKRKNKSSTQIFSIRGENAGVLSLQQGQGGCPRHLHRLLSRRRSYIQLVVVSQQKRHREKHWLGMQGGEGPSSAWSSGREPLHPNSEPAWQLEIIEEKPKKLGGKVIFNVAAISGEGSAFVC